MINKLFKVFLFLFCCKDVVLKFKINLVLKVFTEEINASGDNRVNFILKINYF